jgi:prepilin-type N-terminal cleavage/methylation domain-containing protein/prepilin-type processing-associated H-X9-DG protein
MRAFPAERPGGFTLVELLVVIAIVAVLAAILLAVFPRVRGMARRGDCTAHLRQLAQAAIMYAQDYDRRLVPARAGGAPPPSRGYTWCVLLQPHIRNEQILICPNDPEPKPSRESTCLPHSYGINYQLTYNTGWGATHLTTSLTHTRGYSETILFFDMRSEIEQMGASYLSHGLSRVAPRHEGLAQFAFLDGHVKALKPEATVDPVNMWAPR